jgi:hypothetical protein
MDTAATRQFTFRLPGTLVARVETCVEHIQSFGMPITRADIVRLLLSHALDHGACKELSSLFARAAVKTKSAARKRVAKRRS